MKKLLVAFSIFCLFVLASCSKLDEDDIFPETGSDTSDTGSSNNDTSNTDITDTVITDSDNDDIDDSDTTNSDNNDTGADTGDTSDTDISNTGITDNDITDVDNDDIDDSDNNDTGDSGTDTGDTSDTDISNTGITDNDITDVDNDDIDDSDNNDTGDSGADTGADEPHECSVDPATPCKAGNLIWSSRSANTVDWDTAKSKCASYSEGKFTSGWRLPKINELRKVMRNCTTTETGGNCGVTDECALKGTDINGIACYTNSACKKAFGDICSPSLEHSPFGETGKLWTALKTQDDPDWAWYVSFYNGEIAWAPDWTDNEIYYRCVHAVE